MGVCRLANYKYFYCFNNSSTYAAGGGGVEISAISISSQLFFWATTNSCFGLYVVILWKTTRTHSIACSRLAALRAGVCSGGASSSLDAGVRGGTPGHWWFSHCMCGSSLCAPTWDTRGFNLWPPRCETCIFTVFC